MGKNIYKSFLLLIALLCMVVSTDAQTVSVADAMLKAQSLRGSSAKSSGSKSNNAIQLAYTSEEKNQPLYYVFNYPEGGFAIIGGDEKAREILGYCTNGAFNIDSIPDGMRFMLKSYGEQIASAIANGSTTAIKIEDTSLTDIPQLITTQWDQNEPYNCMIPSLGSGYSGKYALATGCAPTAAAQIMKYYNYPSQGSGSPVSYNNTWNGSLTLTFQADFSNTTYDWNNMIDSYGETYSSQQAKAVGTLIYHIGVAVHADYGQIVSSGTSTDTNTIIPAFTEHFGYSDKSEWKKRKDFADEEWENLIYSELKAGRPLFYAGQSTKGGHAFICDGYDASLRNYHFNWGWGGYCDGYYPLTGTGALQPNGSGIGGAGGDAAYTNSQSVIVGLQPAAEPVSVTDITLSCSSATLAVGDAKNLSATVTPSNATRRNVTWSSSKPDVAIVDATGVVTAISAGEAVITATSIDGSGISASCAITVSTIGSRANAVIYNSLDANVSFSTDNDYEWTWNETDKRLQSSNRMIANTTSKTTMTVVVNKRFRLAFDFGVSSESKDKFTIQLDGQYSIDETKELDKKYIYKYICELSAGTHKFTFKYAKDDYLDDDIDRAFVSNIKISAIPGDANCDGKVDVFDIVTTVKYLHDSDSVDKMDTIAADINGDNSITADDITSIQDIILKKENKQ